jgi:hypothetical protein
MKVILDDLSSLQNETTATNLINTNSRRLETAMEKTLSRDGTTPNTMAANIDMNSNRILNLPEPTTDTEPVRSIDVDFLTAQEAVAAAVAAQEAAETAQAAAELAETNAETAETNAETAEANAETAEANAELAEANAEAAQAAAELASGNPSVGYNFDALTTDSDPGAGDFRFNHGTPSSATVIYFDNVDRNGVTVTTWLDSFDDSSNSIKGQLIIKQGNLPSTFCQFNVTGTVVDGTGYRKVSVTNVSYGGGSFTAGAACSVLFIRTGEAGTIGGATGGTDNAVLRADGTGGATLQNSLVTIADTTGDITTIGSVFAESYKLHDSNDTHYLEILTTSNLTANHTLTLVPGDADRTLTLTADSSIGGTALVLAGGQTVTGGFQATSDDEGTKSSGTFTPTFSDGNVKRYINGGAHTLAPPSGEGSMVIQITNNSSAGAVTTSGFTKVSGDVFTTTDGHDFLCFVTIVNGFSHLYVQAMQ